MISQMDRNWIFGINYAKPQFAGVTRYLQADRMKEAKCTSTRDGLDLPNIWTGVDQYDWNAVAGSVGVTYDEAVNISRSKGFEVIGLIIGTPTWALSPGVPPEDNHRWPPREELADAFIRACTEVASHFLGRIRYFEYWNEENSLNGWHSYDPAEYTRWLIRAYQGVKAGNPNALLAVGGCFLLVTQAFSTLSVLMADKTTTMPWRYIRIIRPLKGSP